MREYRGTRRIVGRMPGEPVSAFHAFRLYLALGPSRSLAAAWRRHRRTEPAKKTRGRPRCACAETCRVSGQWTAWSSEWKWSERAARYDAKLDAKRCQARLEKIKHFENRHQQDYLKELERLRELVSVMEAVMDRMDQLPAVGYKERTMYYDGKGQRVEKTREQVDLLGYSKLVKAANRTAQSAITGIDDGNQRFRIRDFASKMRFATNPMSGGAITQRLLGESAREFRAYCAYRDQGARRSIAGAWTAHHGKPAVSTEAVHNGRRQTRRPQTGHWAAWSRRLDWVARAHTHDVQLALARRDGAARFETARLAFELHEQDRLEARIEKMSAVLLKTQGAPIVDSCTKTERFDDAGKRAVVTSVQVKGISAAGLAAFVREYFDTLRHAVVGHSPTF